MARPLISLVSVAAAYGTHYRITGHTDPQAFDGLMLHSELTVNEDYSMPAGATRFHIAKWLREFADAYQLGSEESDKQKIARLEKELNDARTKCDSFNEYITILERRIDTAVGVLEE